MALVSLQQKEKLRPKIQYRSLHDQMIAEAELTVRHNWSDVAIHDRDRLNNTPAGHYCAWIVGEFGTYLTPLWCSVSQRERWESNPIAPIQVLCMRWLNDDNPLTENRDYLYRIGPYYQRCYIIVKSDECGSGTITPIDFGSLMDICLLGQYKLNEETI